MRFMNLPDVEIRSGVIIFVHCSLHAFDDFAQFGKFHKQDCQENHQGDHKSD